MNRRIIVAAIIVIVAAGATLGWSRRGDRERHSIRISGNIEVTDVELSFRLPGRVQSRPAAEGRAVAANAVVATLDPVDLEHAVALREAELAGARAKLAELHAGSRPEEIQQARAALRAAESDETRWRAEEARSEDLYAKNVISRRELESAQSASATARERRKQAREALELVQKGPRHEAVDQARARVEEAEAALAAAKTQLAYATLTSPVTGIVIAEHAEAGEQVAAGTPIVTVADLNNVWLRGYIDETDLGHIRLGQRVRVTTDSSAGKAYDGVITFISSEAEFTPKSVQTEKERVKLVYRIKVTIANPRFELKPGMPADGEIVLSAS